jgi:hypothetical protein
VTDLRLFTFEGKLVFSQKMLFADPVIDEIPRKAFIQALGTIDEKVGIDLRKLEGLGPVAVLIQKQENRADPSITQGQQGLDIGPLGEIKAHLNPSLPVQCVFQPLLFFLEFREALHGEPLKRGERFWDETIDAELDLVQPSPGTRLLDNVVFDGFHEFQDCLHVFL